MKKSKRFNNTKFSARLIRQGIERCRTLVNDAKKEERLRTLLTRIGDETWNFDDLEEFLSSYANDEVDFVMLDVSWADSKFAFELTFMSNETNVYVSGDTRASIEAVFSVFSDASAEDRIEIERGAEPEVTIFIGHGRNKQWEKLKSHLQDKHELNIIAYETGARAGHTIRDILDSMARDSSLALLVLTGEDKSEDGIRARQNVIHECGLFQGRLGFDRGILLVEEGVELASNFDGIQQLRFKKGRITEVFGDVIATIRREFGPI